MNARETADPATWSERYESLRGYVLKNRQILGTDPVGLIVLLRCGVAGWMRRWTSLCSDSLPRTSLPEKPQSLPIPDWQRQLTILLAQMTAQHFHPTPTPST